MRMQVELGPWQHAFVVMLVIGIAMCSALWVPNVEFIFGLTGATASIFIGYIMPAVTFIRLLNQNPELTGTGAGSKALIVPPEVGTNSKFVFCMRGGNALSYQCSHVRAKCVPLCGCMFACA